MYTEVGFLQCGYWLGSGFLLFTQVILGTKMMRIPTDEPLVFSPQTEIKCWVTCIQSLGGSDETVQCPVHKTLHRISSYGWFSLFSALKSLILLSWWLWNNDMGTLRFPQRNRLSKIGLYLPGVPRFVLSQGWEYSVSFRPLPDHTLAFGFGFGFSLRSSGSVLWLYVSAGFLELPGNVAVVILGLSGS